MPTRGPDDRGPQRHRRGGQPRGGRPVPARAGGGARAGATHRRRIALREGSTAALEAFEQARSVAAEVDHLQAELLARADLVDGLLAADRPDEATAHADWIREQLDGRPDAIGATTIVQPLTKPTIAARRALGRAARANGDHGAAVAQFESGLETAREHCDSYREARLLFEIAATHRDRGDAGGAEEAVEAALAAAADLGAFGGDLRDRYRSAIDDT